MTTDNDHAALAGALTRLLGLSAPPLAIAFAAAVPPGLARYDAALPAPTADGRTGAVPAGCVFWMKGTERSFATVPADHGNCSVGGFTHGLLSKQEATGRADVAALCEAGWIAPEAFDAVAHVGERPGAICYGPLAEAAFAPDVVLLRLNAKQAMLLHDAWPGVRIEGKPQCHIVAIAHEHGEPAMSVGCMLSRVRTGMTNNDMTCAVPAALLGDLVAALEAGGAADAAVAAYAAADAKRFS